MRTLLPLVLLALSCIPAPQQARIEVTETWASPTPGGADISAGYLTITNHGAEADRLVSAESARASSVELHSMDMEGGVMRMRAIDGAAIAPGEALTLAPGGEHLMFVGLTAPFTEGEVIPVRLHFEKVGDIDVSLPVRRPGATQTGHGG